MCAADMVMGVVGFAGGLLSFFRGVLVAPFLLPTFSCCWGLLSTSSARGG